MNAKIVFMQIFVTIDGKGSIVCPPRDWLSPYGQAGQLPIAVYAALLIELEAQIL